MGFWNMAEDWNFLTFPETLAIKVWKGHIGVVIKYTGVDIFSWFAIQEYMPSNLCWWSPLLSSNLSLEVNIFWGQILILIVKWPLLRSHLWKAILTERVLSLDCGCLRQVLLFLQLWLVDHAIGWCVEKDYGFKVWDRFCVQALCIWSLWSLDAQDIFCEALDRNAKYMFFGIKVCCRAYFINFSNTFYAVC